MLKQYKLRFYNFRLIIFLLAISLIGVTPANCFDRRSDAAVPTSVTPIRLIASRKMISLKL